MLQTKMRVKQNVGLGVTGRHPVHCVMERVLLHCFLFLILAFLPLYFYYNVQSSAVVASRLSLFTVSFTNVFIFQLNVFFSSILRFCFRLFHSFFFTFSFHDLVLAVFFFFHYFIPHFTSCSLSLPFFPSLLLSMSVCQQPDGPFVFLSSA